LINLVEALSKKTEYRQIVVQKGNMRVALNH
jgi:hypothetical protein